MTPFLAEIVKQPARFDCLKHPTVIQLENLNFSTFHLIALVLFILAIIHTLSVSKIQEWARKHEGRKKSFFIKALYFCSEVEVVFALWVIPLFFTILYFYGWDIALQYLNTRDYTEPLFVVVIMAIASTRPIVHAATILIQWIAKRLGNTLSQPGGSHYSLSAHYSAH